MQKFVRNKEIFRRSTCLVELCTVLFTVGLKHYLRPTIRHKEIFRNMSFGVIINQSKDIDARFSKCNFY